MACSYVGAGVASASLFTTANASAVASGDLTPPVPSGAVDDILVYVQHAKDNVDCSMGGTWARKAATNNGASQRMEVWWKRATATSESAPTVTHTGGGPACGVIHRIGGCVTSGDPWEAAQANAEAESAATPFTNSGVTVTTPGSMVFLAFGSADDNSWTYNAGFAVDVHFIRNQNGTDNSVGIAYGLKSTAAATGDLKVNQSALGADAGMSWSGVLKAASSSGIYVVRRQNSGTTPLGADAVTPARPVEAGNTLVIAGAWEGGTTISGASDTAGNTFDQRTLRGADPAVQFFVVNDTDAHAANQVTLNYVSPGGSFNEWVLWEIAGLDTSGPVDQEATNNGNSNSADSGTTGTTSQADEIALAVLRSYQTVNFSAPTNGFEEVWDGDVAGAFEKILSATGTQNVGATVSASNLWIGAIITLKAASTGLTADGDVTTPAPTVSGAATLDVVADAAQSTPTPTVSASVAVAIVIDGAVSTPAPTVSATVTTAADDITADGDLDTPAPTVAGTAALPVSADGAIATPLPAVSGTAAAALAADGAAATPAPTVSAQAALAIVVGAELATPAPTVAAAAGTPATAVDGAVATPAPAVSASVALLVLVAGGISTPAPTLVASSTTVVAEPDDLIHNPRTRARGAPYPQRGPLALPRYLRRRK